MVKDFKFKIAINGKANSGKNTIANIFGTELSNGKFIVEAFANPIKEIILIMFPQASRECLFGPSNLRKEIIPNAVDSYGNPLTYRQCLIDIGKAGRAYNENIWVDKLSNSFNKFKDSGWPIFIVSDLRFREEFYSLKKEGFILIRIKRNEELIINDISEKDLDSIPDDKFDFIIENNSTIDVLKDKVGAICKLF